MICSSRACCMLNVQWDHGWGNKEASRHRPLTHTRNSRGRDSAEGEMGQQDGVYLLHGWRNHWAWKYLALSLSVFQEWRRWREKISFSFFYSTARINCHKCVISLLNLMDLISWVKSWPFQRMTLVFDDCRCLLHPLFCFPLLLWYSSVLPGDGFGPVHQWGGGDRLEEDLPHVPG